MSVDNQLCDYCGGFVRDPFHMVVTEMELFCSQECHDHSLEEKEPSKEE